MLTIADELSIDFVIYFQTGDYSLAFVANLLTSQNARFRRLHSVKVKVLTSSFNPVVQYIHSVRSKRSKVFFLQIGFGPESSLHKKEINSMLKRTVDCIVRGEGNTKQPRPHSTSTTLPPNPPGTPVSQPNPPGTPVSQCETPPAAVVSNLIRFALSALQPQWHPHTFIFC